MMDSTRTQPSLYNLKASPLPEHNVGCRNADVVERDVTVAVGSIIVTENGEHTVYGDTRSSRRYENDGLLTISIRI